MLLIDILMLLFHGFDLFFWHLFLLFFKDEGEIELCELLYHLDYLICDITSFASILHTKFVLVLVVGNGDAQFEKSSLKVLPRLQLFE